MDSKKDSGSTPSRYTPFQRATALILAAAAAVQMAAVAFARPGKKK
ncbi:MAG: hypothetical protein LJU34_05490 [Oscillospiraceae bacterium]|nr:hypothetical protein [Oscillospiraceae bacterium]